MTRERYAIETCLLDEVQYRVDAVLNLCEKHTENTRLFDCAIALLEQKHLIEAGCYSLERKNLNNSKELLIARFANGTELTTTRRRIKQII